MKKRASALIMDILILVLCASMLFLAFLYAQDNVRNKTESKDVFDKLWIVNDSGGRAFTIFNTELCTPNVIAYKPSGKDAGALIYNDELMLTLYAVLSDVVLDVFGEASVCKVPGEEYDVIVSKILAADSYLYLEYADDLPFPFIYTMASGKASVDGSLFASGITKYLSRLFLILETCDDGSTVFTSYAFDNDGDVVCFEHADQTPYVLQNADKIHLEAYSDIFTKAKMVLDGQTNTPDLTYGSLSYSSLDVTDIGGSLKLENEAEVSRFLELFGMNPEKTRSYIDSDETRVFIGSGSRLTATENGKISFSSEDEQILLKELLGYSPSVRKAYSIFDMLKATNIFIDEIMSAYPNLVGNDAALKLSAIYRESKTGFPVFEYSYFRNGILIDCEKAFIFAFDSVGIRLLDINLICFTDYKKTEATLPKNIVAERLTGGRNGRLLPIYCKDDTGLYSIAWAEK